LPAFKLARANLRAFPLTKDGGHTNFPNLPSIYCAKSVSTGNGNPSPAPPRRGRTTFLSMRQWWAPSCSPYARSISRHCTQVTLTA